MTTIEKEMTDTMRENQDCLRRAWVKHLNRWERKRHGSDKKTKEE